MDEISILMIILLAIYVSYTTKLFIFIANLVIYILTHMFMKVRMHSTWLGIQGCFRSGQNNSKNNLVVQTCY